MNIENGKNFHNNAILLNNLAIASLLQRNYNEATSTLQTSFTCLKAQLDLQDEASSSETDDDILHVMSQSHRIQSVPIYEKPDSDTTVTSSNPTWTCDNNAFACFNRAFTIPLDDQTAMGQHSFLSYVTRKRLTSILFYNMGLVNHNDGIVQGNSEKLLLALRFYTMAYAIIETSWDTIQIEDMNLLLFGLFNNMGHIHSSLFNIEETKVCVRWVRTILQSMEQSKLMEDLFLIETINQLMIPDQQLLSISPAA